jgi:hypothetical protein
MNMNGNECREVRQEIDESALRQSMSANTEAHVAACGACQTFRDERVRLRELVGGLKPVTAPADFEMKLRARIARERDVPKQPFIFRLVMSTPAIVMAAVLVIAVGAVLFVTQRSHQPAPARASINGNEQANPAPTSTAIAGEKSPEPLSTTGPSDRDSDTPKRSTPLMVRNGPKSVPVSTNPQADDYGVRGAQNIKLTDRAGEVSLSAPTRSMVVTMYDEHGATRKIQLPPISFGSQRLTDRRTQVSMTNTKDW